MVVIARETVDYVLQRLSKVRALLHIFHYAEENNEPVAW